MLSYLATCDSGLEDLALQELKEKTSLLGFCREGMQGRIWFDAERKPAFEEMHSLFHVVQVLGEQEFASISPEAIREAAVQLEWPEFTSATPFRCSCNRIGSHDFSSVDVERIVGGGLQNKYQLEVNLKHYLKEALILIEENRVIFGIRLTRHALSKRYKKSFIHRGAIKYTLAHAMLQLLRPEKGARMLDPFCGSGSIVMQAAALFGPSIEIWAGDLFAENIAGTQANLRANAWEDRVKIKQADARQLDEEFPGVTHIVSNLPFGKRVAKNEDMGQLLGRFIQAAARALPEGGRLLVLVHHPYLVKKEAEVSGKLKLLHSRHLRVGTHHPRLLLFEKKTS